MDDCDQSLSITTGHDPDGTPVIALAGELDVAVADDAARAFGELPLPGDGDTSRLVVDMGELTFMDSAGLTVLLQAVKRGHAVRLRRPTHGIRQLIAITGLERILPIEP